jgi:hypothetical protein
MSARGSRPRRGFTPGPTTLLALYPRAWRRRYGDELDALILDMHADGRRAGVRMRVDLLRAAFRERLRAGGDPSRRVRGGASLVLWAWALFVNAGVTVAKTSEHWQRALPGAPAAHVAFSALQLIAFGASAGVAGGIVLTLPAAWRLLSEHGWRRVRARAMLSLGLSAVAIAGTAAIVVWAHSLGAADRNGQDGWYTAAFLAWRGLLAACLFAWTSVATRIAADVRCPRLVLRAQAWLAPAVTVAMAAMTVATLTWWAIVAARAPGALTGGPAIGHSSPVVPQLVVAAVLMALATGVASLGAVRADGARAEL